MMLQIFKGGDASSPAEYNGPREADGIVSYLQKQSGPASVMLSSKDAVTAFVQKEVAVVGVFSGSGSAEFKTFSGVSDILRDEYDFGHVFDAALLSEEADVQVRTHSSPLSPQPPPPPPPPPPSSPPGGQGHGDLNTKMEGPGSTLAKACSVPLRGSRLAESFADCVHHLWPASRHSFLPVEM